MSRLLVTYVSQAGSTAGVAEAIAEELGADGAEVELLPMNRVGDLDAYDAIVLGAPMILGWHDYANNFVIKHQDTLGQKPTAVFITCYSLTDDGAEDVGGVPVFLDPQRATKPRNPGRLGRREKFAQPVHYFGPVLEAAPAFKPLSVAFFGGGVDYGKVEFFQRLFLRFIIRAQEGDFRNWDAIRQWAAQLRPQLTGAAAE